MFSDKKILAVLLCCMFAAFTFTGCKDDGEQNSADKNKKTRIGILTHLNVTEEKYNEYMEKLEKSYRPSKANLSADYSYFNNLNEMIMALDANKIDLMSTYKFVAEYMVKRKENLEIVPVEKNLEDSFCFAVREDDKELLKNLDDTISDMLSDGTMKNLSEKFIENVINGKEPEPVPIKEIDGADKIKVAVTGDLPPFDMVLADGSPAGFNTAVMAEISRRIGKNIELVDIDSGTRAESLVSKKIDIVFWAVVPKEDKILPADIDKPKGVEFSQPYYTEKVVHIALKK